jgi:hypothetical protein
MVESLVEQPEESMVNYISKIHPISWYELAKLPFGGRRSNHYQQKMVQYTNFWVLAKPLFGVPATSSAESENNGYHWNNIRYQQIFTCLLTYCCHAQSLCNRSVASASKRIMRNHNVTPSESNIFQKGIDNSLNHQVELGTNGI